MRLRDGCELTYCANIHPGESWAEVRAALLGPAAAVKRRVRPDAPFGVGLRLSAAALERVDAAELRAVLAGEGLYIFTVNGFPYGRFHGAAVKRAVYRPDWRDARRLAYTNRLADLLAALLPEGGEASLSTVPGCFRPDASEPGAVALMADALLRCCGHLAALHRATGRLVRLALEPEPCCWLETADDVLAAFSTHLHSPDAARRLAALSGLAEDAAAAALRRHLGLCLDACHAAVEFEDAEALPDRLEAAGIGVFKLQVSAGLSLRPDAAGRRALARFDDGVYLHQVVARGPRGLRRYTDLAEALGGDDGSDEWRAHVHVPLFAEGGGVLRSTRDFTARLLARHRHKPVSRHLEVETYTWDVLPPELRQGDVVSAIARELAWTREAVGDLDGGA